MLVVTAVNMFNGVVKIMVPVEWFCAVGTSVVFPFVNATDVLLTQLKFAILEIYASHPALSYLFRKVAVAEFDVEFLSESVIDWLISNQLTRNPDRYIGDGVYAPVFVLNVK